MFVLYILFLIYLNCIVKISLDLKIPYFKQLGKGVFKSSMITFSKFKSIAFKVPATSVFSNILILHFLLPKKNL